MEWIKDTLELPTHGKGMIKINSQLEALIRKLGIQEGMRYLFLQRASCSLAISEGFDPPARADVEEFYERLAPELQNFFLNTPFRWVSHPFNPTYRTLYINFSLGFTSVQPNLQN